MARERDKWRKARALDGGLTWDEWIALSSRKAERIEAQAQLRKTREARMAFLAEKRTLRRAVKQASLAERAALVAAKDRRRQELMVHRKARLEEYERLNAEAKAKRLERERIKQERLAFWANRPRAKTKKESARGRPRNPGKFKSRMCQMARKRGRAAGLVSTITPTDLHWPEFCPVLGLRLEYQTHERDPRARAAWPSLDRWDNSIGYVPGNVYVISWRANSLKSNATADELEAIARYARNGLSA